MRKPPNIWPQDKSLEGYLFFGQVLEEMLFDYGPESYRAPTLTTVSRADEALSVLGKIQKERISLANLEPVLDELKWSLRKDIVAKDILGGRLDWVLSGLEDIENKQNLKRTLVYIKRNITDRYLGRCKELLAPLLEEGKNKKEIYNICGSLCSHIISLGYSKESVYFHVSRTFFNKKSILDEDLFSRFIDRYNLEYNDYHLYCNVSLSLADFIKEFAPRDCRIIERVKRIDGLTENQTKKFLEEKHRIFFASINALDSHTARKRVEGLLSFMEAIAAENIHKGLFGWDSKMYVRRDDMERGHFLSDPTSDLLKRPEVSKPRAIHNFKTKLGMIVGAPLPDESRDKIFRSLVAHSTALKSPNPETQLVHLWSALETFLPSKGEEANIKSYISFVVPTLMASYIKKLALSVFNDLRRDFKEDFRRIVFHSSAEGNLLQKFLAIVLFEKHKVAKADLLSLLNIHPLGRYRIHRLFEQLGKPTQVKKTYNEHKDKVHWQIRRIYRARNGIIHAGEDEVFINSLLCNLHEYYDVLIQEFDRYFSYSDENLSIENVLSTIKKDIEFYEKCLDIFSKEDLLDEENFCGVLGIN